MESKNQPPQISVNIEKFDDRLHDPRFIQVKQDAQGKELVLFLGATGAGKSTCINYLLGAKIDRDIDGGGETIAKLDITQDEPVIDKRFAKISPGNRQPCTLYSEIFYDSTLEMAYCDTAGVLSPSGTANELQVCASLSMQYAIQSASSIKAVVVVEWCIFLRHTPLELYALASLLTQLLVEPEKNADSIIFLINKVPKNIKKQNVAYAISCYKDILTRDVEAITKKTYSCFMSASDLEECKRVARMIDLLDVQIKKRPENIILMDVFDEGQTRQAIYALLKEKKSFLTKEHFSFDEYNESRKAFDAEIEVILPLINASRKDKLNRKKEQENLLSSPIVLGGTEPSSTLQREMEKTVPVLTKNLSNEKLTMHGRQDISEIPVDNDEIKNIEPMTLQNVRQLGNSNQVVNKTPEKYEPVERDYNQKENNDDTLNIILNLVQTNKPSENLNNVSKNPEHNPEIQLIETSDHHNNHEKIDITPSNNEVLSSTDYTKIIRGCANLSGVAIGLFGLFLLGTGIGALAHGTLAASIVQTVFNMGLDDAMACAFVYGFFCLFLSFTIFYVTRVIVDNPSHTTHSSNTLEDVTSNNGYGTFEQSTHMRNNSTALLLKQNIPVQHQNGSNQNIPGLPVTCGQGKISDGLV